MIISTSDCPKDWSIKPVQDLMEVNAQTLSSSTPKEFPMNYISIECVKEQSIDWEKVEQTNFAESPSRARRVIKNGDLLISTVRPNLKSFAIFKAPKEGNWIASTGFAIAASEIDFSSNFYFYQLLSEIAAKQFHSLVVGSNYPAINEGEFKRIKLFDAPLPEQKAIAGLLSKVDFSIKAVKNSIKTAERIKTSLMQNLLTGKLKPDGTKRSEDEFYVNEKFGKVPNGWEIDRIKNLTNKVTDGEHLSPDFQSSGAYLLSAEDVFDDGISFEKAKFVKPDDCLKFRKRCDPDFGDVLIVSRGASIGRTCKVNQDIEFCLMGSVILIKPKNEILHGGYLSQYFKSYTAWVELQKLSGTTAQQAIYLTHINKVRLMYPSDIKEQEDISRALEKFDSEISSKQAKIQSLKTLKKSLMQHLLSGKVRVDMKKINMILEEV